jgi:hypothetical protein
MNTAPHEPCDEGVDREREEDRDQDVDDHRARDHDDVEERPHRHDQAEDGEDRLHREANETLDGVRISYASDVAGHRLSGGRGR